MEFPISHPVIVLVGPTAIGKTELSLQLAEKFNCEIISLDSMQVYRHMDIGTAKATIAERKRVVHHLIDVVDPDENFDASMFEREALRAVDSIHGKGKIPLITGGTGLYLRALTEGLFEGVGEFPEIRQKLQNKLDAIGVSRMHEELCLCDRNSAEKIHKNDKHRVLRALEIFHGTGKSWSEHLMAQERGCRRFSTIIKLGLTCPRDELYVRINSRTEHMIDAGLKQEVQSLLERGYGRELKPMQSIGYRHMIQHILDGVEKDKMIELLARDTRRYAKRQYTWFNKAEIEWCEVRDRPFIFRNVGDFLNNTDMME